MNRSFLLFNSHYFSKSVWILWLLGTACVVNGQTRSISDKDSLLFERSYLMGDLSLAKDVLLKWSEGDRHLDQQTKLKNDPAKLIRDISNRFITAIVKKELPEKAPNSLCPFGLTRTPFLLLQDSVEYGHVPINLTEDLIKKFVAYQEDPNRRKPKFEGEQQRKDFYFLENMNKPRQGLKRIPFGLTSDVFQMMKLENITPIKTSSTRRKVFADFMQYQNNNISNGRYTGLIAKTGSNSAERKLRVQFLSNLFKTSSQIDVGLLRAQTELYIVKILFPANKDKAIMVYNLGNCSYFRILDLNDLTNSSAILHSFFLSVE